MLTADEQAVELAQAISNHAVAIDRGHGERVSLQNLRLTIASMLERFTSGQIAAKEPQKQVTALQTELANEKRKCIEMSGNAGIAIEVHSCAESLGWDKTCSVTDFIRVTCYKLRLAEWVIETCAMFSIRLDCANALSADLGNYSATIGIGGCFGQTPAEAIVKVMTHEIEHILQRKPDPKRPTLAARKREKMIRQLARMPLSH